ncbi:MAG: CRTAC1 family protein, partial [Bacteroidia bacterium]|nr:CRTAC1 family protein [Bacteroidia bacterium]
MPKRICSILGLLMLTQALFAQEFNLLYKSGLVRDDGGSFSASWGDFDNDGCMDLFVVNGNWPESNEPNKLFRNNCDGSFSQYNHPVFALDRFKSVNAAWGDFDQDGWLDLMVGNAGNQSINVYHNDGRGGFDQVINDAILNTIGSNKAYWLDLNEDGWLDIYLANNSGPDKYIRNLGNGKWNSCFVSEAVPFENNGWSTTGITAADIDLDGDMDYFHSSRRTSSLYINLGGGRFRLAKEQSPSKINSYSSGALFADMDNDGDPDLLVGTDKYPNRTLIFENTGNGNFEEKLIDPFSRDQPNTYGMVAQDFDRDGDLDLFLACSFMQQGRPNAYYENQGNWKFRFRDLGQITRANYATAGLACEDFDNDGDVDVFLGNLNRSEPNFLFRNDLNKGHWINIRLIDDVDSLSSWATRVDLKAVIRGKSLWQNRSIVALGSYGQSSQDLYFGLGDAEIIDSLMITWPSGEICIFDSLEPDQFLTFFKSCTFPDSNAQDENLVDSLFTMLDRNAKEDSLKKNESIKPEVPEEIKPKPRYYTIKEPRQNQAIKVSNNRIRIQIWDDDLVDGDQVSIKLGDRWIAQNQGVKKQRSSFELEMTQSEMILEIRAENEGKIPPNTAVIFIDGGQVKTKVCRPFIIVKVV